MIQLTRNTHMVIMSVKISENCYGFLAICRFFGSAV